MKRRLENGSYTELEKVAVDVKLTFDNAILYNPPGQEIHKVTDEKRAGKGGRSRLDEEADEEVERETVVLGADRSNGWFYDENEVTGRGKGGTRKRNCGIQKSVGWAIPPSHPPSLVAGPYRWPRTCGTVSSRTSGSWRRRLRGNSS